MEIFLIAFISFLALLLLPRAFLLSFDSTDVIRQEEGAMVLISWGLAALLAFLFYLIKFRYF